MPQPTPAFRLRRHQAREITVREKRKDPWTWNLAATFKSQAGKLYDLGRTSERKE